MLVTFGKETKDTDCQLFDENLLATSWAGGRSDQIRKYGRVDLRKRLQ